ncbi:ABC transporter permease [Dactylosporangium aurantiacum]|uniref:ABC transporter permease n=1 Tax=Dactylosporangium aurantiacum TaxID=35754 RepID=A0A9Q9I894_9ACTN|nr:ABC transporter permease [Dactylosporangium aurantiacum]MDG6107306.1 ABC transporter permease [Dactylosporangium aurantiacum]UWZ51167.1 ABC transporter permease [Dactylosporangium aurantiacum]
MLVFLARRAPAVLGVLLVSSVLAFALPRLAPGDPAVAVAGADASPEQVAEVRALLGLDRPAVEQYFHWLGGVLTGDLGTSYLTGRPVAEMIGDRIGSTVELAIVAGIIMAVLGIVLGTLGGGPRSPWARGTLDAVNSVLLAAPPFLTGLLLALLLGVTFRVLPVSGEVALLDDPDIALQYLALPALALALPQAAAIARLLETAMRQARSDDYVDLAVAKGARPVRVTLRHVLRNSIGTAVVAIGIRLGELLAGAIVVEAIFARNGLGTLVVSSVRDRDYLVVQVLVLAAVGVAAVIQLLTEVLLATLDPRIRLGVS